MLCSDKLCIRVGARDSKLSLIQVQECLDLLHAEHPGISFDIAAMETLGDRDQQVSLRKLDKTDFFTRDIDLALAHGAVRIGIHSAKDLPEPLHPDLDIVALTRGLDPSDSLVIPEGESLETLPRGAMIATSSQRREEMVRKLRDDLKFVDIRGSVPKRLEQLEFGRIDGVVVAECALLRLGLEHLNRVTLPGQTAARQGQLAIVARKDDEEMRELFKSIDTR